MFHLINEKEGRQVLTDAQKMRAYNFIELSKSLAKVSNDLKRAQQASDSEQRSKLLLAGVAELEHPQENEIADERDTDSESSFSSAISSPSLLSTSSSSNCIACGNGPGAPAPNSVNNSRAWDLELEQQKSNKTNNHHTKLDQQIDPTRAQQLFYHTNANQTTTTTTTLTLDDCGTTRPLAQAAGAPKRSRSLVDDARLDTQRNKQLLDEIRRERQQQQSIDVREEDDDEHAQAEYHRRCTEEKKVATSDEEKVGLKVSELVELTGDNCSTLKANHQGDELIELDEAKEAERFLSDFPRHISELDQCNHLLIKYEPELDPTHPGFHDLEYRQRRKEVAEMAFNYKFGDRIPEIDYNEKERATWKAIYLRLKEAYARYACEQHNLAISQLEAELVYSAEFVPQLQQVSEFLEKKTGWRLRPAAGLLSARDFLASLAFRVFQTTQYIRHWGNPEHSVEPDCIHELMGHIPMLCDLEFAQFSQELGLASLGASDEQIEKFATLYWFTVEFGLCRERGQLKCYGAGLLSSYGEMEHALESGKPALKEFVPEETALETYDDSEYQVVYYVARSFQEAKHKIKQYAQAHLERQFELAYDPYTCTIKELSTYEQLESYTNSIKSDMNRLSSALNKLRLAERRHLN